LLLQAEIGCDVGQFDEALKLLDEAEELIELQAHPVCEAELYRLRARAELSRGSSAEVVEDCFDLSFAVARRQNAKFWELRTAVSRAGYWRDRGKYAEARELLAPVYRPAEPIEAAQDVADPEIPDPVEMPSASKSSIVAW
jgi:hypothetical protein